MFRAYGWNLVVELDRVGVSKGGVVLPKATAGERWARGKIVSRGHGARLLSGGWDEPTLNVGDVVEFQRAHAIPLTEHGEGFVSLPMSAVVNVEREEELAAPVAENADCAVGGYVQH